MIYVDSPVYKKPNGRKCYSHMVADSLDELHQAAVAFGVKKHFFHKAQAGWHYDITAEQYELAIANGALLVSSRSILARAKSLIPTAG